VQFYLDGYRTGDPFVDDPHPAVAERPEGLPEETATSSTCAASTARPGCMVVVRPDQYVAHILPIHGHDALADFFPGILNEAG
jgi:hypothetical protein